MKLELGLVGVSIGMLCFGCSHAGSSAHARLASGEHQEAAGEEDEEFEEEEEEEEAELMHETEVALDAIPAVVKQAALGAVPGLVITEAVKGQLNGATLYIIEGKVDGGERAVVVTPEGTVKQILSGEDGEEGEEHGEEGEEEEGDHDGR